MVEKRLIIALIAIVIVGLFYISARLSFPIISDFVSENFQSGQDTDNDDDGNEDLPPDYAVSGSTAPGGNQGGEVGPGGDTSDNPTSPQGCVLRTVSYSLEDFEKTPTCNVYEGENCVDKTVECSVQVRNLDYSLEGDFELIFAYRIVDVPGVYSTDSETETLPPRAVKEFLSSLQVQGPEAKEDITCNFEMGKAPKREVCY
ncbi:MAG: hypothetical protein KKD18_03365 [Nanoarchaeota archaeon]|nr:hypothetical protein [Nanoarchaeota archaeon]MBU0977429.1 hypothetical protein [Nanoarchaeota archaeon]